MSAPIATVDSAVVDVYLDYEIHRVTNGFYARPIHFQGDVITANDLPTLRKKIWQWWFGKAA